MHHLINLITSVGESLVLVCIARQFIIIKCTLSRTWLGDFFLTFEISHLTLSSSMIGIPHLKHKDPLQELPNSYFFSLFHDLFYIFHFFHDLFYVQNFI
jgi:hypothetical protein